MAADHACWSDEELAKKVLKRRFGGVMKSTQTGLNRMMEAHAEEVHKWITSRLVQERSGNTTEEEGEKVS